MYKKITLAACIISGLTCCKIDKKVCMQNSLQSKNTPLCYPVAHNVDYHKKTEKKEKTSRAEKKIKPKKITIKNSVTKDMTGYTYFGTTYYPTFNIRINNKIVKPGQEVTITTTQNTVDAQYEYSFAKGLYKGKEIIKIDVDSNTKEGEVTFCWHEEKRIKLNTPQPTPIKKVSA